ncbi:MAG: type VI secretion system tip protein VgrG [Phyllobacteriaceae bacterium]|nr:type VI secretion system tip protein VgrG [Phyllobacteriaceae bacterium]
MELYDWPGKYDTAGDGTPLATVKLQAEEGLDRRCLASGNCVTLFAGSAVALMEHPFDYNKDYVLTRAQHSFVSQSYRSGMGVEGGDAYEGQFELLDAEIPLVPAPVTPRPRVHGPQTAVVVGAEGEEIDCDEWGRILVRFHWDRKSDKSMRCRVAQNWASGQWGGMIIPRLGMEVVVEFLEGDPDRPLVTGAVYNAKNMPPYTLPEFKTRSTFRSNSHKAGGFNELRFEDEGGEEEIFLHAQKYFNLVIGDNETHAVGNNRHISVATSQSETIGANKDMQVGGNHT